MLQPKRTKYRKAHKGRHRGMAHVGNKVSFGEYGLKSAGRRRISARQIEAARRVIARETKRVGNCWVRIFPDKPITQKPLEVRQGKGKGNVEYWVAMVRPGTMLFELDGVPETLARLALKKAGDKLGLQVIFVKRTVI